MNAFTILAVVPALLCLALSGCHNSEAHEAHAKHHAEQHKILVTCPQMKDIVSTQQYVCQIHSRRHIEVRALEGGYLEEIPVKEGQAVKQGDLLFKLLPTLYQAKLDSESAEARQAQIEYDNTKKLFEKNYVSKQELNLVEAKLAKARAQVQLAQAELNFTEIKAPFDGIIDRLRCQHGSLISEGDILTTMSDNGVMWVYFNVPESRYLEYKAGMKQNRIDRQRDDKKDDKKDKDDVDDDHDDVQQDMKVELVLANGNTFPQPGKIGAIEADFNNETGNIAFRADFANPESLLRHGQTGTIVVSRVVKDAVVIPQRATYEILAKRYAYVVGDDGVVHQRDIEIETTLDDIFVIRKGLSVKDKIVLEGIGQVRDGDKVAYEFQSPEKVLGKLKYKAE